MGYQKLRPCIQELLDSGAYESGSHSILRLAVQNEISGEKPFKCDTLINLGVCLHEKCGIYLNRRVPAIRRDGVRGEAPAVKSHNSRASSSTITWHIPEHQSKRRRYSP